MDDDQAIATIAAAWDAGIRFFDTAPLYGHGLAESRLGAGLRGYPRDAFVVSSKVGRLLRPDPDCDPGIFRVPRGQAPQFDYSRDGVLRSVEESLNRLGLDRLDVVLVHDPDDHEREALEGAFPALLELRDQRVVRAIGSGMNQSEMLARFVDRIDLDCVLLAGRYTLLDRSGAEPDPGDLDPTSTQRRGRDHRHSDPFGHVSAAYDSGHKSMEYPGASGTR